MRTGAGTAEAILWKFFVGGPSLWENTGGAQVCGPPTGGPMRIKRQCAGGLMSFTLPLFCPFKKKTSTINGRSGKANSRLGEWDAVGLDGNLGYTGPGMDGGRRKGVWAITVFAFVKNKTTRSSSCLPRILFFGVQRGNLLPFPRGGKAHTNGRRGGVCCGGLSGDQSHVHTHDSGGFQPLRGHSKPGGAKQKTATGISEGSC